jgi:hypothetical protein
MSYHINLKEYNCPSCDALYIPYKVNMPCPNCKKIPDNTPEEYLHFIDQIITSLVINKEREGSYRPSAWYIGSFTDYIQSVIFHVFNALENKKRTDTVEVFVTKYLNSTQWDEDAPYRKDYIHSIFTEIYSRRKELRVSLWSSLWSRFLHDLLP